MSSQLSFNMPDAQSHFCLIFLLTKPFSIFPLHFPCRRQNVSAIDHLSATLCSPSISFHVSVQPLLCINIWESWVSFINAFQYFCHRNPPSFACCIIFLKWLYLSITVLVNPSYSTDTQEKITSSVLLVLYSSDTMLQYFFGPLHSFFLTSFSF